VVPFVVFFAWSCLDSSSPTLPEASDDPESPGATGSSNPKAGTNGNMPRFIITLVERESPAAVAADHGITPEYVYTHVLKGFAGEISDAAREGLMRDLRVVRVERDGEVSTQDIPQWGAPWGLDRIDQRPTALDGLYSYDATGAGVTAYILDSGIRYSHQEFGGRARFGFDAYGGDGSDCYGHGTHVAGTVGGSTYGVAKNVALVSVKVLNCSGFGTVSGLVAGMDWVARNHTDPAVVNMSIGANASVSLDNAVSGLIAAGVTTVVAAGNAGADACKYSPARVKEAITVGATGPTDARSSFSNWGRCLDWFAPGQGITSSYNRSDSDVRTMSGTSMATPHTSGVVALYLESAPGSTPAQVADAIAGWTTKDVVTDANSRNADLLYSRGEGDGDPPANQPPGSRFSFVCDQLACQFTDESSDPDGTLTAWAWDFSTGDGSAERNPAYTFPAPGTYPVTLTVTDDEGATGTHVRDVMVSEPSGTIQLTAVGYKVKGRHHADLTWSGATGSHVDLYRDGERIASPENTGSYTDAPGGKGRAEYRYKVCESGSSTCSAEVSVSF
jgi:PKD repeat protein